MHIKCSGEAYPTPYGSFTSKSQGRWRRWNISRPTPPRSANTHRRGYAPGNCASPPYCRAPPLTCLACRGRFRTVWRWARKSKWLPRRRHWCRPRLARGRSTVIVTVIIGEEADGASNQHRVSPCEEQTFNEAHDNFPDLLDGAASEMGYSLMSLLRLRVSRGMRWTRRYIL